MLLVINLVLVGVFSAAAFGQTGPSKIAVINTAQFFAQDGGIKKYEVEYKKLELEFKTDITEIDTLQKRIETLRKEIEAMQANKAVPIKQEAANAKAAEWDKLNREFKFKDEDYKSRLGRREQELVQPINIDIGKRISEFAKQRGFDMVFDVAKLGQDGSVLYVAAPIDMTKDFITYYNALPAGTASR